MIDDTTTLIALLEWELVAAQAREDELRTAVEQALKRRDIQAVNDSRAFGRLRKLLAEPQDDKRLRQRLLSARWEAEQNFAAHSQDVVKNNLA